MKNNFIINGEDSQYTADANQNLLAFLQKQLHILTRVRHCQSGSCGRCLVNMDGTLVLSCMTPFFRIRDAEIITPEGFSQTEEYKVLWSKLKNLGVEEDQEGVDVILFALYTLIDLGQSLDSNEINTILEDFPTLGAPKETILKAVRDFQREKEISRGRKK